MSVVRGMIFILLCAFPLLEACSPGAADVLVLEVGPNKVSLREYENFFTRNSGGWAAARKSSPEERRHFLDLLANYKLKLLDAKDRNLGADTEIVRELAEYRATLATTRLIDREVTKPGLLDFYAHRTEEIRARHILVRLQPDAGPDDTLKAYQKAAGIIAQLKTGGADFASLAREVSDDPTAKQNGGDLYYFTGGQMVSSFERAAFGMKKGQMSAVPVRSPFGYHIISITDRQPVRATNKVSHIMARFQNANDSTDTAAALGRIRSFQDSLRKGWEFHELARKVSEDGGSSAQGGDLGWFERRRFVQPFDEAAFLLKAGETSGVVRTPFGYHLIRCDSAKPLPPYAAMEEELKKLYQQSRYQEDYNAYIARIKKEVGYSLDEKLLADITSHLDSTRTTDDSAWAAKIPAGDLPSPLFSVAGRGISVDTILSLFGRKQELRSTPLRKGEFAARIDRIAESFLLEAKTAGLEDRDPEFGELMKDYRDGIILYKAEQTEVWNRTTVTDSALKAYYGEHADKFVLPEQVNISVLAFESDTLARRVLDSLGKGADYEAIAARYREDPSVKTKDASRGLQPVTTDDLTAAAAKLAVGALSSPIPLDNGMVAVVKLIAKEPSRPKSFQEAGAEVSNAYQEYATQKLEEEWLDGIRKRYPVTQHPEALRDAFAEPEARK